MMTSDQLSKMLPYVELDRDTSARYEGMSNEDIVSDLVANGVDPMEFAMAQAKARMAVNGCLIDLERGLEEHPMQVFKRAQEASKPKRPGLPSLLEQLFQPPTGEELDRYSPEGQEEPPEEPNDESSQN